MHADYFMLKTCAISINSSSVIFSQSLEPIKILICFYHALMVFLRNKSPWPFPTNFAVWELLPPKNILAAHRQIKFKPWIVTWHTAPIKTSLLANSKEIVTFFIWLTPRVCSSVMPSVRLFPRCGEALLYFKAPLCSRTGNTSLLAGLRQSENGHN